MFLIFHLQLWYQEFIFWEKKTFLLQGREIVSLALIILSLKTLLKLRFLSFCRILACCHNNYQFDSDRIQQIYQISIKISAGP